jgi:septal ring factor EnvC (AmiA/AmiB activator)
MATVNAAEAEQAILDLLEPLFCSEEVLQRLVVQVQKRFAQERARRAERRSTDAQLRSQLTRVEAEIGRLVDWIAKGTLV